MNIILLFICLNVFLPLMTVEGLPFYNPDSCYYHANTAPDEDPAISPNNNLGGSQSVMDEIRSPTNSTDSQPFDFITEPVEQLYSGANTAKEYIVGGYVTSIIDHIAVQCVTDPSLASTQYPDGRSVIGYIDNNPQSSTYTQMIKKYHDNGAGGWTDNTCPDTNPPSGCFIKNEVIEHFKTGINLIMAFLIIFLLFYWLTGKGHLITS